MLHGRDVQCAVIDRLLADAGNLRSGALVVRGEVGVGKSALLTYAADRAAGTMRVLWGFGVESESELAFAALHQIVRPVLDHVERLPGPQAAALQGALGLATTGGNDRFLIAVGTLSLLAEVAEERPLVCLVDDAQWLDQPSADALTFAARRLEAEGIVLLFAARDDDLHPFSAPGFHELRLTGLDADAASALLTERSPAGLAPAVRDRLIEATQGNPLALLELPASLTADQLAGRTPVPDPLPVSAGVEQVFLQRVRRLPGSTQTLLLAAAAEETGDPAVVFGAAQALGAAAQALGAAETAGLVRISEGRIWFHHPLVRSAVYRGATFSQRQAIHQALAAALQGAEHADRRAWHRAAAAMAPDPEVADELERSAERARRRSGYSAAARALERSAELTAAEELRSRRLAGAADAAWLAGQPDRALGLLDRAASGGSQPRLRADIAHLRGVIELHRGVPADAFTILAAGSAEVAPADPVKALAMLLPASEAASYAGDVALTIEAARRAAALPRREQRVDQFTLDLLVGIGSILEGDTARGAPLLRQAVALAQAFDDPTRLGFAGAAARYLGDDTATHDFYARAVARARATGRVILLPYLLESLAVAEVSAGRYTAAAASASEGLRLARETGQESSLCRNLSTLALLAAMQGREDACRSHAAEALERAVPRGLRLQAASATWALALLDLGLNRSAEALARLETLAAGSETGHQIIALLSVPDLVEAAVRANQTQRAQTALAGFEQWASHTTPPWALALVPRCRGLLSAGAVADRHFAEALRLHSPSSRPFDRARTELLYGQALRRARRRAEAREHLRAALTTFEQLGAAPWAERARTELRVSGETPRQRDPSALDQLTPQELQVVRFVGEGATNREVAAQLFLSPRTIDYHLRQIFTKLGISSRAELIRLRADERLTSVPEPL
ncbi:MAG TPA: LuxR C-terminal-related transcriptional regulator [Actinomycetota bacterium]|nr:LuxR C-terminal-related transcriptional regulator [Actinomycetota bacterium]